MKEFAFLFTDIEGSTVLWERHPIAMQAALARHDDIMRRSIEMYHGRVFKTFGDAFCAVFSNAADALYAAVHVQHELAREDWGEVEVVRVRMAIHRGLAEERDGDYFGPTLNRVARLMASGHGGQILLSHTVVEDVRNRMPPGGRLVDLGEHRLKDLVRPEHIAHYADELLRSEFPLLRSLDACANNLPIQLTSFVGREGEVAEIRTLQAGSRLVTLCGAGGSGKTRLALQAAAEVVDEYPNGAWFVELAPVTDPLFVPHAVASALRLVEKPGQSVLQTLTEFLRTKSMLVVFDNCEHLVGACAVLIQTLLQSCPNVKILATSRESLSIPGETTWRVPSLSLPPPAETYDPNGAAQYGAVRLFVDRAFALDPRFSLSPANVGSVVQICRRLDGIPLAIELAAARIGILRPEEISLRLDDRFHLLTGGSRTALPRQQTLRAAIDWSYQLLGGLEGLLFRRLSVFIGGFTLETAESVCGGDDLQSFEIFDCLCRLVDKSLVIADDESGANRYRMLETIQGYAADKLEGSGESEIMRRRHLEFFLKLAEQAEAQFGGAHQGQWFDRLEREHDNLRAALTGNGLTAADAPKLLRLSCCLARFWMVRGYWEEGLTRLRKALESTEPNPTDRAKGLNACGHLACQLGDYTSAELFYRRSIEIRRSLGDERGVAAALNNLGLVHVYRKDFTGAHPLLSEALQLFRKLEQPGAIAATLSNLATIMSNQGDHAGAESLLHEALHISEDLGDPLGIAARCAELGRVALRRGDLDLSRRLLEDSLHRFRQIGEKLGAAEALQSLGDVAGSAGEKESARSYYEESLTICRSLFARRNVEQLMTVLAQL